MTILFRHTTFTNNRIFKMHILKMHFRTLCCQLLPYLNMSIALWTFYGVMYRNIVLQYDPYAAEQQNDKVRTTEQS